MEKHPPFFKERREERDTCVKSSLVCKIEGSEKGREKKRKRGGGKRKRERKTERRRIFV